MERCIHIKQNPNSISVYKFIQTYCANCKVTCHNKITRYTTSDHMVSRLMPIKFLIATCGNKFCTICLGEYVDTYYNNRDLITK